MKCLIKTGLLSSILAFGCGSVFADHHEGHKAKCSCSKECSESCKKGQGKDCTCEKCDCKKTGDCGESCDRKSKE